MRYMRSLISEMLLIRLKIYYLKRDTDNLGISCVESILDGNNQLRNDGQYLPFSSLNKTHMYAASRIQFSYFKISLNQKSDDLVTHLVLQYVWITFKKRTLAFEECLVVIMGLKNSHFCFFSLMIVEGPR